jgi:hypothetical protein
LTDRQGLHVFLQIKVHELKDEVQLMAIGVDDIEQAKDVGIVHFLEQADFANGGGRDALVFGLETNLLEGNDAVVGMGQVAGFVDDSVRACGCCRDTFVSDATDSRLTGVGLPSPTFSIFW